jgi:hypothetical protein
MGSGCYLAVGEATNQAGDAASFSRSAPRSVRAIAAHEHPIKATMLAVIVVEAGFVQ